MYTKQWVFLSVKDSLVQQLPPSQIPKEARQDSSLDFQEYLTLNLQAACNLSAIPAAAGLRCEYFCEYTKKVKEKKACRS